MKASTKKTTTKATKTGKSVYEIVTDRIVAKLEQGEIPWLKPWSARKRAPRNLVTGKTYRGMNVFLLACQGYDSPYWLTFKQVEAKGGNVKKGEKGTPVIFWHFPSNNGLITEDATDAEKKDYAPFLRYYTVFNVAQCEGIEEPADVDAIENDNDPIEEAEAIVAAYLDRPEVKHGFNRACYIPSLDEINMPALSKFRGPEEYYSTLFHELAHSTGHEKRIGRHHSTEARVFGDEAYSKEELTAEMTAAFLCAEAGIEKTIDNAAAYIQSWLKALQNDKKMLIVAAGAAQKAADYIMGTKAAEEATAKAA